MAATPVRLGATAGARTHPTVILAVLSLGGMGYAFLSSAVLPALPVIGRSLHASETDVTWVLTAYLLSASVSTSIIGRLGDMFGKQQLLLATLGLLVDATLIAALAHSLPVLIFARVLQGTSGGIFPLAYGIVRDELPAERVPGSIGLMSSILGVGTGVGVLLGGLIVEHMSWHWLFWFPLAPLVVAMITTYWFIPGSPTRVPGRVNWAAALLMGGGITAIMLAVSESITWGWGSARTIGLIAAGLAICAAWIALETRSRHPLIDMSMMRIRAVWSTNLAGFLLGAGMISGFIVVPQFVQMPTSTGYGFGASVFVSGLYLLPVTLSMAALGTLAGKVARRYGSRHSLLVGALVTTGSFAFVWVAHRHPFELLIWSLLLGLGLGLSYSAIANLVVQSVTPQQTGAASGMNTVVRLLGGAIGGQISATFIADHVRRGLPTVTGFTETFAMSTGFMIVCTLAVLLVPGRAKAAG
jgi:MFS family permease